MRSRCAVALLAAIATLAAAGWPAVGQTPKRGGILNAMLMEDPPGFSIHESSTISGVWPVAPCYSNLVTFDPLKPVESVETVIAELAERWSWQDSYRNLVLFLRKNVKWHDGKPFSSADVKYTFDVVREAKDAPAKLRLSPRKDWYANVEAIEAPDAHTVICRLKRPQPSLILMLASGYSPVYPAHVPLAELRQRCVGTGPFRLKEYTRGQMIELERNPKYFVKDRPYLDGIRYPIITERGTRLAALQTGRLDTGIPLEMTKLMAETIKKNVPSMIVTEIGQNGSDNVVMNHKKPPFERRHPSRRQPGHGPPRLRQGRPLQRRRRGRRAHAQAVGILGAAGQGPPGAAGLPRPGRRQGRGQAAARSGRRRPRQAVAPRADDACDRHLRGPGVVRRRSAPPGRGGGGGETARHRAVLPGAGPSRVRDRRQPHRGRVRRSRRLPLRELQVRDGPELHRLLQRGDGPAHRRAVRGARSRQAAQTGVGDPTQARGRRGPADAGLAYRVLHSLAVREEPRPPQLALQLRSDAGGVAGQVGKVSGSRACAMVRCRSARSTGRQRASTTPRTRRSRNWRPLAPRGSWTPRSSSQRGHGDRPGSA